MTFGIMLELFGVREIAEVDILKYNRIFSNFKNTVGKFSHNPSNKDQKFQIFLFRDFCYVFSSSSKVIKDFISYLQITMLKTCGATFRGSLMSFNNESWNEKIDIDASYGESLTVYENRPELSILFSKLVSIKGIGINSDFSDENLKTFQNVYMLGTTTSKYREFNDLYITSRIVSDSNCFKYIYRVLLEHYHYSKTTQYLVPFVVNLVKSIDFQFRVEKACDTIRFSDSSTLVYFELFIIQSDIFNGLLSMKGGEVIGGAIIQKFFSDEVYEFISDQDVLDKTLSKGTSIENLFLSIVSKSSNEFIKYCQRFDDVEAEFSISRILLMYYSIIRNKSLSRVLSKKQFDIPQAICGAKEIRRFARLVLATKS